MSESLRDQLSKVTDEIIARDGEPVQEAPAEPAAAAPAPVEATSEPDKPGRTAGRERDAQGRLLPGPAKRESAAPSAATPQAQPEQAAPVAAEPVKRPSRPSSWKKEHWEHFDQIATTNPTLAEYINQREAEYAKGVSTYKQEWERDKPLREAVEPLKQFGVDPAQQISRYVQIHKSLATGSQEQRLSTFMQLARDYRVPIEQMFVRGQDGQVYFNQQLNQPAQQQQQQPDVSTLVDQKLAEREAMREIERMKSDTEKYPHFEEVKATMSGLLQAGLADDYPSAYQAALRHPRHSELFDAIQKQEREAEAVKKAEEQRKAAEVARRNAVSTKTATPATASAGAKKGSVRDTVSAAFETHVEGRV